MTVRVVVNKRLDMTDDEFKIYKGIVKSYDSPPEVSGEDFFHDLFETDDQGTIVCLIPPSKRATPIQIYLFLITLMVHQQLRLARSEVKRAAQEAVREELAKLNLGANK
jgi:hypothetical protein